MPSFKIEVSETVASSTKKVFDLYRDGKLLSAKFLKKIDRSWETDYSKTLAWLQKFADGELIPEQKRKELVKNKSVMLKLFEYRGKLIRIYTIEDEIFDNDIIMVFSGTKKTQGNDIDSLNDIAKEYYKYYLGKDNV